MLCDSRLVDLVAEGFDVGIRLGGRLAREVEPMVRQSIAAGHLETVLDPWLPPFDGFYLYYPSRFQVPPKLRVFIDFPHERLANTL